MKLSVIIVSATDPSALDKVLTGYALQTWRDFEVIVSTPVHAPASGLVAGRTRAYPVPLRQLPGHDDVEGDVAGRAIDAARGDYLLFTKGDCVPRPDLVAAHARLATPGRFLSGGSCRLEPGLSRRINRNDIVLGRCFEPGWLHAHGPLSPSSRRKLEAASGAGWWLDVFSPAPVRFDPRNASAWKDDLAGGHGGPARRLHARGVRGRNVRGKAMCLQLAHGLLDGAANAVPTAPQPARDAGLASSRYG